MELEINRLDHYGVVAGVIKDLKLVEQIDSLLGVHELSEISHGEAIAGMILNGLGFTDRPLSLTPQFFENKPLELLFRPGVRAEHFNRFKLGRTLDVAHTYGCEALWEIPLLMKCWDGNSDDNSIFQHRSKKLVEAWKDMEAPRYLIMDSKGYSKKNAINLKSLNFITRIPETNKPAKTAIQNALNQDNWESWDEQRKYTCLEIEHYEIQQLWIVVFSEAAFNRSEKTVEKASIKEKTQIDKALYHLQAERFETETEAKSALEKLYKKWKYHQLKTVEIKEHKKYQSKGRPGKNTPFDIKYQISNYI